LPGRPDRLTLPLVVIGSRTSGNRTRFRDNSDEIMRQMADGPIKICSARLGCPDANVSR
jgi:hypothetical protein